MTIKLCLVVTALILASCGGGSQSYEYHAADDPLPGPGLFSGPDGTFTIYQSMEEKEAVDKESSNR
ncbi:MAG: hypothetical protein OEU57_01235 [Desulfuromonadales bacterium]|nr:hypothetical protein [Desulfuromonadales bacterium]